MGTIANLKCTNCKLRLCCQRILQEINGDLEKICENTKICKAVWVEERQYCVIASTCYRLYTYSSNKNPKWEKKCETHLYSKTFVSKFTEHGKRMEPEARRIFIEKTRKHVIKVDLVVSRPYFCNMCVINKWEK